MQSNPVTIQKEALAPVRVQAQEYLETFQRMYSEHRPTVLAALESHNKAVNGYGIQTPGLRAAIVTALQLLDSGANGFKAVIGEIDGLDLHTVHQGWHKSIPSRLDGYRSVLGELDRMVGIINRCIPELEKLVREATPVVQQPLRATASPAMPGNQVVHHFDPRMKLDA